MKIWSFVKAIYRRLGLGRVLNFTTSARVGNRTVKLPSLSGLRATITEPWMTEVLAEALKHQGGAFLDIGVNLGQTLVKVKSLDPRRPYIGLEPNPVCVNYCRELIRANSFTECEILPVGLFTQNGLMKLDFYSDNDGADAAASLIENFRDRRPEEFIWVPAYNYETLNEDGRFDSVRIVKIDVEGAELEVLRSLCPLISTHHPIILIEVLPAYSVDNLSRIARQNDVFDILSSMGYQLFRIHKTNDHFSHLERIEDFGIHSRIEWTDYYCAPVHKGASEEAWPSWHLSKTRHGSFEEN